MCRNWSRFTVPATGSPATAVTGHSPRGLAAGAGLAGTVLVVSAIVFTVSGPASADGLDEQQLRAMCWHGRIELSQLLTYALPAYGAPEWAKTLTGLCSFPADREVVHTLASELAHRLRTDPEATFDRPIRMMFHDPGDWDADDERDHGPRPIQPQVTNGMHRIAAAVLAGARWVKVVCQSGWDDNAGDEVHDGQLVRVRSRYTTSDGVDGFDVAVGWLRSFRLTPQVWVECDGMFQISGVLEWIFYCPHDLADELVTKLKARASQHGLRLVDVRADRTTWDELNAEDDDPDA